MALSRMRHGRSFLRGLYQFFERRSCSTTLSRLRSATSRFSFAFSDSSVFSFFASDASIPPYFAFHLYSVVWLIPCLLHSSPALPPAACSFSIWMICSSVNRLFMNLPLWYKVRTDSTSSWTEKWGAGHNQPGEADRARRRLLQPAG